MKPATSGLSTAAIDIARGGWPVFPCNADKSPRTRRGFHDASTDPEVIAAWDWDGALIGAAVPEGFVVVDVDPRNGGDEKLPVLEAAGPTRVVATASGGKHFYFSVDPALHLRGSYGPGVDIKRAEKGYVIAPPSPGYRVVDGDAVAPLPHWLSEELRLPDRAHRLSAAAAPKFFAQFEEGTAYGMAARDRQLGRLAAAGEGERNNALNRAAFSLAQLVAGGELDEESTSLALVRVARQIGLKDFEVERTIESGWAAGLEEPWQSGDGDVLSEAAPDEDFWLDWDSESPDPEYLCDPILPEQALVLVYGPAAASKSMVCVALGAEASRHGFRTTVYSLENSPSVDRHRLRRLRPDKRNFRLSNKPLNVADPRQFAALVEREKEWGTRLLVLDTYSESFDHRADDGNAKAIHFYRLARQIMHEVGSTIVILDHTGYVGDAPRDASAKLQKADVGILMASVGTWEPGKPATFSMQCRKASRFGNPFYLTGQIVDGADNTLALEWSSRAPTWVV